MEGIHGVPRERVLRPNLAEPDDPADVARAMSQLRQLLIGNLALDEVVDADALFQRMAEEYGIPANVGVAAFFKLLDEGGLIPQPKWERATSEHIDTGMYFFDDGAASRYEYRPIRLPAVGPIPLSSLNFAWDKSRLDEICRQAVPTPPVPAGPRLRERLDQLATKLTRTQFKILNCLWNGQPFEFARFQQKVWDKPIQEGAVHKAIDRLNDALTELQQHDLEVRDVNGKVQLIFAADK